DYSALDSIYRFTVTIAVEIAYQSLNIVGEQGQGCTLLHAYLLRCEFLPSPRRQRDVERIQVRSPDQAQQYFPKRVALFTVRLIFLSIGRPFQRIGVDD